VSFTVRPDRDLTIYDDVRKAYAVDPGRFEVQIGASSADIRAKTSLVVTD
jgi:beta-glucosidase